MTRQLMTQPAATRREVLAATAAALGLGLTLAPRQVGATPARTAFLVDSRLPEAAALAARARQAGHVVADPKREMVQLLLGPQGELLTGANTIIGLTTYSDLVLASDVLRGVGRSPHSALSLPLTGGEAPAPLLTLLHEACQRRCASLATSYLWLA